MVVPFRTVVVREDFRAGWWQPTLTRKTGHCTVSPGETRTQTIERLAGEARRDGVTLTACWNGYLVHDPQLTCRVAPFVTVTTGCSCRGFTIIGRCRHHSLMLLEREERRQAETVVAA